MKKKTDKISRPKPSMDKDAAVFFERITAEYSLTTTGLELLRLACHTLTRWRSAKEILDAEGVVIQSGNLSRIHPACKCEHDARLSFCRMIKELNLDAETSIMEATGSEYANKVL